VRQPTADPYAWHAAALRGDEVERHPEEPNAGWFKRRLVRGGPYVPARIWLTVDIDDFGELTADEVFYCEVNGNAADPYDEWPALCANPIPQHVFDYMESLRRWAAWHAPNEPQANPRKPIDWLTVKPPVFT
jgi:hypothetical protein